MSTKTKALDKVSHSIAYVRGEIEHAEYNIVVARADLIRQPESRVFASRVDWYADVLRIRREHLATLEGIRAELVSARPRPKTLVRACCNTRPADEHALGCPLVSP